jgi:hypothetical protein
MQRIEELLKLWKAACGGEDGGGRGGRGGRAGQIGEDGGAGAFPSFQTPRPPVSLEIQTTRARMSRLLLLLLPCCCSFFIWQVETRWGQMGAR